MFASIHLQLKIKRITKMMRHQLKLPETHFDNIVGQSNYLNHHKHVFPVTNQYLLVSCFGHTYTNCTAFPLLELFAQASCHTLFQTEVHVQHSQWLYLQLNLNPYDSFCLDDLPRHKFVFRNHEQLEGCQSRDSNKDKKQHSKILLENINTFLKITKKYRNTWLYRSSRDNS